MEVQHRIIKRESNGKTTLRINPYVDLHYPGDLPRDLERTAYRVAGRYNGYQIATLASVTNKQNSATLVYLEQAKKELQAELQHPDARRVLALMMRG